MTLTFRTLCTYMAVAKADIDKRSEQLLDSQVGNCHIDSRSLRMGDVFFAFRGDRVNGEDYVASALEAGAVAVVVSKAYSEIADERIIPVENVQWALQELAKGYRNTLNVPIIGITGSVGKTSTKDLLAHVLSDQVAVYKTKGNLNNELGLPLSVLELTDQSDLAVLEMGMNHYGEIARLVEIARPQIAIITNIGTAHIEFFGSREGIFRAKMEIASQLEKEDLLILNAQDDLLCQVVDAQSTYNVVGIGRPGDPMWAKDIVLNEKGTLFTLCDNYTQRQIQLNLWGKHHVSNALLALTVVKRLKLDLERALESLKTIPQTPMRFERVTIGDCMWINDAYNASMDSMIGAVETIVGISEKPPWIIFGDVFECGDQGSLIHTQIGDKLNQFPLKGVVFIGHAMVHSYNAYIGNKFYFVTVEEALVELPAILSRASSILVKASRGMALERILKHFQELIND